MGKNDALQLVIADDHRLFRQGLMALLEPTAFFVVGEAASGLEAVEKVLVSSPDVILLDILMPGIDGIEVLRRVKQSHPHIEVIILTGHGSEKDRTTCMELGAFAYLQKPVDIEALSETLRQANEKARRSDPGEKPSEEGPR